MCRGHLIQASAQSWPRNVSDQVQIISMVGNSTASPDTVFHCQTTLMVETLSIMSEQHFPCSDMCPSSLALSLSSSKKKGLAQASVNPTIKIRKCQVVLLLLFCCKKHPTVFRYHRFLHRTLTSLQAQKTNYSPHGIDLYLAGSFCYWGKFCLFCALGCCGWPVDSPFTSNHLTFCGTKVFPSTN